MLLIPLLKRREDKTFIVVSYTSIVNRTEQRRHGLLVYIERRYSHGMNESINRINLLLTTSSLASHARHCLVFVAALAADLFLPWMIDSFPFHYIIYLFI